jgi:hypothetical protein
MDRQQRREEMYRHIAAWKISGKTQRHYCEECGEQLSVLQYWIKKQRDASTEIPGGFAQVISPEVSSHLEIVYPNGVKLRFPSGSDLRLIRQFLAI